MASNKRPQEITDDNPDSLTEEELPHGEFERACMVPFSDLKMQPIHEFVLIIWRHLCIGYATDNFKTWDHTMDVAEARLGMVKGPAFVSHCVTLMRALRYDRAGGFNFLSPEYKQATKDEQVLVKLVRISQESPKDPFKDKYFLEELKNLVNSTTPVRTILAVHALANICKESEDDKATPVLSDGVSNLLN